MHLKDGILGYIENKEIQKLKSLLQEAEAIEILFAMGELSGREKAIVFRLLPKDSAIEVFEQLDSGLQQTLLQSFTDEKVIEIVNEMAPDDRVRLLDEMPAKVAKRLLGLLSPEERKTTNILMGYEPETAGRVMTTEYMSLKREMTVADAIAKIKLQAIDKETIYTLYVTDALRKLEGVVTLKDLIVAEPTDKISDVMSDSIVWVRTDTDQEKVARKLQKFDLLAIPVVDSEDRLVGIVTIDDAIDILQEEATEDMYAQAGIADVAGTENNKSQTLISGSIWRIWRVRLPFLLITMAAGLLAGLVIDGFENALKATAAAVFIPLIMDMGGNVGTQSSTVFARGVVLGHIDTKNFGKFLLKEVFVGFSMGLLVGIVSGIIASAWQTIGLGLAVGLSLVISMTLASFLGFIVPFLLIKLKVDQAAGSAPIITSIKDIVGLLVYFVCVTIFLGIF